MSGAIGPGDWVEFIGPDFVCRGRTSGLTIGAVYQVRGVEEKLKRGKPLVFLTLREVPRSTTGFTRFVAEAFRPIYKPKAELIEGLLKPVESKVDA